MNSRTHIVLIGASIGQQWNLAEWPNRERLPNFSAESVPAWQFDKTAVVEEVSIRPRRKLHLTRTYLKSLFQAPPRKPGIVILKECSSYFPGNLDDYEKSISRWTEQLQKSGSTVMLATVVPVTSKRSQQDPGKQEGLLRYNRWVREFSAKHNLQVLDLEAAMQNGEPDHYLKEEYAVPDGSHLNQAAYVVLDRLLKETICGSQAYSAHCEGALSENR